MREALVVVLLLLAGCASGPVDDAPSEVSEGVAYRVTAVSEEGPGGEPVLAVSDDGTLFLQGLGLMPGGSAGGAVSQARLWRSKDDGATWDDVTPALASENSGDAFVATAPGAVYYATAHRARSPPASVGVVGPAALVMFRSDDGGASWEPLPPAPIPMSVHRMWVVPQGETTVHVAVSSLAAPVGTTTGLAPTATTPPLWYLRSEDRGETWSAPVIVDTSRSIGSDLEVLPDGTLAIALWDPYAGGPVWRLMRSRDAGATWEGLPMFGDADERTMASGWMSLDADASGALYFAYVEVVDGRPLVFWSRSDDVGGSWTPPRPVRAPATGSQMLPWLAAHGEGDLAFSWYAADVDGEPGAFDATWHAELALVHGARSDEPTVETRRVAEAVHAGDICIGAFCGTEGSDRRLLEFSWILFDEEGRAHAAFARTLGPDAVALPVYVGPKA